MHAGGRDPAGVRLGVRRHQRGGPQGLRDRRWGRIAGAWRRSKLEAERLWKTSKFHQRMDLKGICDVLLISKSGFGSPPSPE